MLYIDYRFLTRLQNFTLVYQIGFFLMIEPHFALVAFEITN